jgi:hypothetical protein
VNRPVVPNAGANELSTSSDNRFAEHIQRIVDSAPLLSQHQKDRLAVLLRGAGV